MKSGHTVITGNSANIYMTDVDLGEMDWPYEDLTAPIINSSKVYDLTELSIWHICGWKKQCLYKETKW
jgi:hypothetical protein